MFWISGFQVPSTSSVAMNVVLHFLYKTLQHHIRIDAGMIQSSSLLYIGGRAAAGYAPGWATPADPVPCAVRSRGSWERGGR